MGGAHSLSSRLTLSPKGADPRTERSVGSAFAAQMTKCCVGVSEHTRRRAPTPKPSLKERAPTQEPDRPKKNVNVETAVRLPPCSYWPRPSGSPGPRRGCLFCLGPVLRLVVFGFLLRSCAVLAPGFCVVLFCVPGFDVEFKVERVASQNRATKKGRRPKNRAKANRGQKCVNVVVVPAFCVLPACGCCSAGAWCFWSAVALCFLFFSFSATTQKPIFSGLRPRASRSSSRTGGTSGRERRAPNPEPELSGIPYAVSSLGSLPPSSMPSARKVHTVLAGFLVFHAIVFLTSVSPGPGTLACS